MFSSSISTPINDTQQQSVQSIFEEMKSSFAAMNSTCENVIHMLQNLIHERKEQAAIKIQKAFRKYSSQQDVTKNEINLGETKSEAISTTPESLEVSAKLIQQSEENRLLMADPEHQEVVDFPKHSDGTIMRIVACDEYSSSPFADEFKSSLTHFIFEIPLVLLSLGRFDVHFGDRPDLKVARPPPADPPWVLSNFDLCHVLHNRSSKANLVLTVLDAGVGDIQIMEHRFAFMAHIITKEMCLLKTILPHFVNSVHSIRRQQQGTQVHSDLLSLSVVIPKMGCDSNIVSFCTIIDVFLACDHQVKAPDLFDEMLKWCLCPIITSFNRLLHGLCKPSPDSSVYLIGLSLLTMSHFISSLKPCNTSICQRPRKVYEMVFFFALYCIWLGTGGYKPCLQNVEADPFADDHMEERKKMSFFNWWNFALCFALLRSATMVVYVQDFHDWGAASHILTTLRALFLMAFYVGNFFYRYRKPKGCPLTSIFQVLIAAIIRKRNLSCPSNYALLYEVPKLEKSQGRLLRHTSRLWFLDKVAIIEEKYIEQKGNPWRFATLTRVEETKLILHIVSIWLTSLATGVCVAQGSTLFVRQALSMNLKVSDSFSIPPTSITSVVAIGALIFVSIYDKIIAQSLRKVTGTERGINILQRIGIGLTFSIIVMVVAALVVAKRLRMAAHEIYIAGEIVQKTMSVLIPGT